MADATLEELKAARDKVLLGRSVVTISSGGRSVSYGPANLEALERRIRTIEAEAARPVSTVHVRSKKGW